MTTLREAAQRALEALEADNSKLWPSDRRTAAYFNLRAALAEPVEYAAAPNGKRSSLLTHMMNKRSKEERAALAEQESLEPDIAKIVNDNLWNLYVEDSAEPVAWESSEDGKTIQDNDFTHDVVLRVTGDFENDGQRISYAKRIVNNLNAAPPQRKPLTEEEIEAVCAPLGFAKLSPVEVARAIERAHGIGGNDE